MTTPNNNNDTLTDTLINDFALFCRSSPHVSIAVAAIQALTNIVRRSKATTMMELQIELKAASDILKATHASSISLAAGCELFTRYVTRTSLDIPQFDQCVARILERGVAFGHMSANSRRHIAEQVDRFIRPDITLLIHGYSRVVTYALVHAARQGKNFRVVVTEGRPACDGYQAVKILSENHIPCTLILDSAVGYSMENIDMVLTGAEGVVESGGIINKIGTYQIAMVSKAMKRPFYVAAECYKFARLFPLNQKDLNDNDGLKKRTKLTNFPSKMDDTAEHFSAAAMNDINNNNININNSNNNNNKGSSTNPSIIAPTCSSYAAAVLKGELNTNNHNNNNPNNPSIESLSPMPSPTSDELHQSSLLSWPPSSLINSNNNNNNNNNNDRLKFESPLCDYTPPEFITLLFTDLGILTPSAVSDELIKLYA